MTPSIMTFSITKKSNAKHNSNIVLSVVYAKWCIFVSIASLVTMLNVVMLGNKNVKIRIMTRRIANNLAQL